MPVFVAELHISIHVQFILFLDCKYSDKKSVIFHSKPLTEVSVKSDFATRLLEFIAHVVLWERTF